MDSDDDSNSTWDASLMGSQTPSSSDPSSGKKNINRGRWTKEEVYIMMLLILTIYRYMYQCEGPVDHAAQRGGKVAKSVKAISCLQTFMSLPRLVKFLHLKEIQSSFHPALFWQSCLAV